MDGKSGRKCLKHRRPIVLLVVDIMIWLSVGLPALYLFLRSKPYVSGFFCDDPSLSYPFKPDTISTSVLTLVGFSTSIVVIILVEMLNYIETKYRRQSRPVTRISFFVQVYFFFLTGFAMEQLVVDLVKNMMGIHRPNFFDVCKPQFNISLCPGYVLEYNCTSEEFDAKEVHSSRQSFPSGHTAFSTYVAIFLCMYIQRRLHISYSSIFKTVLQFALAFLALLCGLGRIRDNKHHPSDVIAGWILGCGVAAFMFNMVVDKMVHFVPSGNKSNIREQTNCSYCFCTTGQHSVEEPQTPALLLQNEYHCDSNMQQSNSLYSKTTNLV